MSVGVSSSDCRLVGVLPSGVFVTYPLLYQRQLRLGRDGEVSRLVVNVLEIVLLYGLILRAMFTTVVTFVGVSARQLHVIRNMEVVAMTAAAVKTRSPGAPFDEAWEW